MSHAGPAGHVAGGVTRAVQSGVTALHGVTHAALTREGEWLAAVYAMGDGAGLALMLPLSTTVALQTGRHTVAVPKRRRPHEFTVIVGLDPRDIRVRNGIAVTISSAPRRSTAASAVAN